MTSASTLPGIDRIVAVASGKGGVGKTTIAANLALALRRSGLRIGIFDADLHGPNVHRVLGYRTSRDSGPLVVGSGAQQAHLIPLARADRGPYITPQRRFGLVFMSVGLWFSDQTTVTTTDTLGGQLIRQTLEDVAWGKLDVLIIDLPPGTGEPQQTLLSTVGIDAVLLVTTPHDLSLVDTNRSAGLFRAAGTRILGAVENMSYHTCEHCGRRTSPFTRSAHAALPPSVPILARLPLDSVLAHRSTPITH